jgi:hypothetical protein
MDDLVTWRGSSGSPYKYWPFPLDARFKPVDGNYIYAKRNLAGGWDAVYVGQGDLSTRAEYRRHYKGSSILEKGATQVHVRVNPGLQERMNEWADILDGHPEAFEPTGCNGTAMTGTEGISA